MIRLLVMAVSTVVRQFVLPNPFECFENYAILINWIAEPIIHLVAFVLVGQIYTSGDCPPLGSLLYLFAYALIVGLLWIMGLFSFAWWWVLIILVALAAIVWYFVY